MGNRRKFIEILEVQEIRVLKSKNSEKSGRNPRGGAAGRHEGAAGKDGWQALIDPSLLAAPRPFGAGRPARNRPFPRNLTPLWPSYPPRNL